MTWNESCPHCGKTNIVGVEYAYSSPNRYDGISEWNCRDCGYRQGRWSGDELKDGQEELRYGKSNS